MKQINAKKSKIIFNCRERLGYAGYKRIQRAIAHEMSINSKPGKKINAEDINFNPAEASIVITQHALPEVITSVTINGEEREGSVAINNALEELFPAESQELESHAIQLYLDAQTAAQMVADEEVLEPRVIQEVQKKS